MRLNLGGGRRQGRRELPRDGRASAAEAKRVRGKLASMFRQLDPQKVTETTERIAKRIGERFAESGLESVAAEVVALSRESAATASELGRPILWLRALAWTTIAALVLAIVVAASQLRVSTEVPNVGELVQSIESLINDVIFAGVAIYFILTIETRIKRRRALAILSQLRSIAHVIDMHQLEKDPVRARKILPDTASSPAIDWTPALTSRYLDYCSELLAVLGKLAALCVERFNDSDTLDAVNEIEDLTTGLSRKIWQKIMILDRIGEDRSASDRNASDRSAGNRDEPAP